MQNLFPSATEYNSTRSRFLPLLNPIHVSDFEVTRKMVTSFNSRFERSHINLKTHRDAILNKASKTAIDELAEKFPDYACFILLGECEIPFDWDQHTVLDAFRLNVTRNDSTRKIFVTLTLQRRTSLATHKQMLLELVPLMSGVTVSIPEEKEELEEEELE